MARLADARRRPNACASPSPLLVTAQKSAELCGTSIRTWRTWCSSGTVPAPIRIGRSLFWRREELEAWVAAGCPPRTEWTWPQR